MDCDNQETEATKNMKEKTADEMFEELGYKKDIDNEYETEYIMPNNYYINFNKNFISIEKGQYKDNMYLARPITRAELQAINKKCEELKWI